MWKTVWIVVCKDCQFVSIHRTRREARDLIANRRPRGHRMIIVQTMAQIEWK